MSRRNNSGTADGRPNVPDEATAKPFRRQTTKSRKSGDGNVSWASFIDGPTYEIEICEKVSPITLSSSRRALCSTATPSDEDDTDTSKDNKSLSSSKSDTGLENFRSNLAKTFYPSFCIAAMSMEKHKPQLKTISDADTSPESSSGSVVRDKPDESSSSSSSTTSSSASAKPSRSSVTDGCHCPKCVVDDSPRDSTRTYTVRRDGVHPTIALELIQEVTEEGKTTATEGTHTTETVKDDDNDSMTTVTATTESGVCKCEMFKYEERLRTLEELQARRKIVPSLNEDDDKTYTESGTETQILGCDCANTLTEFTEIKARIDALERLYTESFGKKTTEEDKKEKIKENVEKEQETLHNEKVNEKEPVSVMAVTETPVRTCSLTTAETKSKSSVTTLLGELDEATKTAVELAKIKQRLVVLETRISKRNEKTQTKFNTQSVRNNPHSNKDKKVAVNITTNYVNTPASKLSDKETQVEERKRKRRERRKSEGDRGRVLGISDTGDDDRKKMAAAYWVMKNVNPRLILRDEAIQAPSRDRFRRDDFDEDEAVSRRRRQPRRRRSFEKIYLCKDCDYYLAQKLRKPREEILEKIWEESKKDDDPVNKNLNPEGIHKLRKSFQLYNLNSIKYDEPEDDSIHMTFRQEAGPRHRDDFRKFRTQIDVDDDEEETGGRWQASSRVFEKGPDLFDYWDDNVRRDQKKSPQTFRVPQQTYHVYRSEEVSRAVFVGTDNSSGLPDRLTDSGKHYESTFTVTGTAFGDSRTALRPGSPGNRVRLGLLQCFRGGKKMKVPILFEEVCSPSEVGSGGIDSPQTEMVETGVTTLQRLLRKFSHPSSDWESAHGKKIRKRSGSSGKKKTESSLMALVRRVLRSDGVR